MSIDQLVCFRCKAIVPVVVHSDTGGLCRQCQKTIPKRVEVVDLVACMRGNDKRYRGVYFDNYCKRKPSLDALPILREAVRQDDHYLVKCAAIAIEKLKDNAKAATPDLLTAAAHVDQDGMPQAYCECLAALVSINKTHPEIIPLIRMFMHIDNWGPISSSLKALATLGTDESVKTMGEILERWDCEFDKTQKRVADKLLAEAEVRTKENDSPG
jgi:hypothetical protein